MNPYVFIVGCPRSGTTLLQKLLDANPHIAVLPETHWIRIFFHGRIGMTGDGYVKDELISHLVSHPRFPILQMERTEISDLLSTQARVRFENFVSRLFDRYGEKQGKQFVGDKTPAYIRELLLFHRLWPEARFIHLIRDGRDVALSAISWNETDEVSRFPTFATHPIETSALWWENYVRLGREAGAILGTEFYFELRYENLLVQREKECKDLCRFLSIQFNDSMFAVPIRKELRNWEVQMKREDQQSFESASGDLLDELAYDRTFPEIADKKKTAALQLRRQMLDYLQCKGLRIPAAWR